MKVYLSGKITEDSNYRQKFNAMAEELLSYGYVVFNPAILPDGFAYEDYMDVDLLIFSRCDAIFILRDVNKDWAEKSKQLSENVESKIKDFDPVYDEETNLLQVYEEFEDELKQFFIEEFIFDSDKQIEYDIIEKMNGIDFEEKIKLTQMYKTAADLVELFREKMDKAA